MPEQVREATRVPMTLRESFFEDPIFKSSSNGMESARKIISNNSTTTNARSATVNDISSELDMMDSSMFSRGLLHAPRWLMPSVIDSDSGPVITSLDSNVLSYKEDEGKMEVSLDTSGYKPEELRVQVSDGSLKVEGKHEEKSEEGHTMVSRQFTKCYSLPQGAKKEDIVSNLSEDGVMVITVPKEIKLQEIKDDKQSKSAETCKEQTMNDIKMETTSKGTQNDLDLNFEESVIPFTMRDLFFRDPFFQDTRADIMFSRNSFFQEARKSFAESLEAMDRKMNQGNFTIKDKMPYSADFHEIKICDTSERLEFSVDTSGYKPDELRVTVGEGMVSIEGKHEEKSEAGKVMVSRQFHKSYALPQGAEPQDVVSNLSKDGVLIVTLPKRKEGITEEKRKVHIQVA